MEFMGFYQQPTNALRKQKVFWNVLISIFLDKEMTRARGQKQERKHEIIHGTWRDRAQKVDRKREIGERERKRKGGE